MAKLTLGDKTHEIPDLNFIALELAWPYVQEATVAVTPISGISASIMVIAAGIITKEDFNPQDFGIPDHVTDIGAHHEIVGAYLKRNIRARDASTVKDTFMEVLEEAGLEVSEGELLKVLEEVKGMTANPSTGTAPATSLNLSPRDVREEAGTP